MGIDYVTDKLKATFLEWKTRSFVRKSSPQNTEKSHF